MSPGISSFLEAKRFQIALDLFVRNADVAQRNVWMRVVENVLQLGNVPELLVNASSQTSCAL